MPPAIFVFLGHRLSLGDNAALEHRAGTLTSRVTVPSRSRVRRHRLYHRLRRRFRRHRHARPSGPASPRPCRRRRRRRRRCCRRRCCQRWWFPRRSSARRAIASRRRSARLRLCSRRRAGSWCARPSAAGPASPLPRRCRPTSRAIAPGSDRPTRVSERTDGGGGPPACDGGPPACDGGRKEECQGGGGRGRRAREGAVPTESVRRARANQG